MKLNYAIYFRMSMYNTYIYIYEIIIMVYDQYCHDHSNSDTSNDKQQSSWTCEVHDNK